MCGVQDLKPAVFALNLPANNLIRFSDDFGGETNVYQGFDVNLEGRFRNGAFLKAGIGATSRTFDNCNLLAAGSTRSATTRRSSPPHGHRDLSRWHDACHREYPFRPDAKLSGSYTLPWDIQLAGTYQYSRGVQTGGAGPSIQANLAIPSASAADRRRTRVDRRRVANGSADSRGLSTATTTSVSSTCGCRSASTSARYRLRFDFDVYNMFNSSWPYTVSVDLLDGDASSQWLRPTNVLQSRFFKLGGQFSLLSDGRYGRSTVRRSSRRL